MRHSTQTTGHNGQTTTDDRRQTTDDRRQTTDFRRQTTNVRCQMTDDGRQTTDNRNRNRNPNGHCEGRHALETPASFRSHNIQHMTSRGAEQTATDDSGATDEKWQMSCRVDRAKQRRAMPTRAGNCGGGADLCGNSMRFGSASGPRSIV